MTKIQKLSNLTSIKILNNIDFNPLLSNAIKTLSNSISLKLDFIGKANNERIG